MPIDHPNYPARLPRLNERRTVFMHADLGSREHGQRQQHQNDAVEQLSRQGDRPPRSDKATREQVQHHVEVIGQNASPTIMRMVSLRMKTSSVPRRNKPICTGGRNSAQRMLSKPPRKPISETATKA